MGIHTTPCPWIPVTLWPDDETPIPRGSDVDFHHVVDGESGDGGSLFCIHSAPHNFSMKSFAH